MSNKEYNNLNNMSGDNNKGGSPLSKTDWNKSILEMQLRRSELQAQIDQINETIEYLTQQRDEIMAWQGNNEEKLYRDVLGMEFWDSAEPD